MHAGKHEYPPHTRRNPHDPHPSTVELSTAARRQQRTDARAIHERHAAKVQSEPCPVPAYHPQQLISQVRARADVNLPADLDDGRRPRPNAHAQVTGLESASGTRRELIHWPGHAGKPRGSAG